MAGGAILALLSFLNSTVEFERANLRFREASWRGAELPSSDAISTVLLNFDTLGADIAWSWTVVESGEARRAGRSSDLMPLNIQQVVNLDPRFYAAYEWFPGAYLLRRWPVTKADLDLVNRFIDIGIEAYPLDPYLPYSAALNYIGYSAQHTEEERLAEAAEAIRYLELSSRRPGADVQIPSVVAYFANQRRKLSDGSSDAASEDAQTLLTLLATSNSQQQPMILESLQRLGVSQDTIAGYLSSNRNSLDLALLQSQPYLPMDFWLPLQEEKLQ